MVANTAPKSENRVRGEFLGEESAAANQIGGLMAQFRAAFGRLLGEGKRPRFFSTTNFWFFQTNV
jgi:hypothetical protein